MPQLRSRAEELEKELDDARKKNSLLANNYRNSSLLLAIIAVGCSAGASIAGLIFQSGPTAGILATVPVGLAIIAIHLKLESRAAWFRRKEKNLDALWHHIKYELPDPPTPEQIAMIASEYTVHEQKAQIEIEKHCVIVRFQMLGHTCTEEAFSRRLTIILLRIDDAQAARS